jgi:ATP-dependent exoDNAse (exonuclease V) beta subunit
VATGCGSPGEADEAARLARGVGVLAHRLLELWTIGPRDDPRGKKLLSPLPELARRIAAQHAVDEGALRREAEEVLDRFLSSDLPARLADGRPLARELPLLLDSAGGPVWQGSIDLLLREPDGGLVVVDYKTDRQPEEAGLRQRHVSQLAVYAEAVRRVFLLAEPPRAELWLLRHGRVVECDTAAEIARLKLAPGGG